VTAPSTAWKEVKRDGEDALFETYAQTLAAVQAKVAETSGTTHRALHAKKHVGLRADLEVLGDLPEHARHGLFATPKTYPCYVRLSNGDPKNRNDKKPDVRGFAIKVVGVPGKKIISGLEDAVTQDFLTIPSRALGVEDVHEFMAFFAMAQNPATLVPKMFFRFGPIRAVRMLASFAKNAKAPASLFAIPYFSGAAIQCGPYAAQISFAPRAASHDSQTTPGASRDALREEAIARVQRGSVELDVRLQFFVDEAKTPIERHSVIWQESDAPFVTVARVTIPKQDATSTEGKRVDELIEKLSFDPWHALVEHKPLGNVMRARNVAYRVSTQARRALPEPTQIP